MKKGIQDYLKGILSFLKAFILNMFTYKTYFSHARQKTKSKGNYRYMIERIEKSNQFIL